MTSVSEATPAAPSWVMGLGFDVGWAKTGVSAVAWMPDGRLVSAGSELILTAKEKRKEFEHLRVSADDMRRLGEQYAAICSAIERVRPAVIGVECYTIFESKEYETLRDAGAALAGFLGVSKGKWPFKAPEEFTAALGTPAMLVGFVERLMTLGKAVDAFRVQRGRGDAAKTYGVYSAVQCAAFRYGIPCYGFMPVDLKKRACGKAKASKEEVAAGVGRIIEGLHEKIAAKVPVGMIDHCYDAAGHAVMAIEAYRRWMHDGLRVPSSSPAVGEASLVAVAPTTGVVL